MNKKSEWMILLLDFLLIPLITSCASPGLGTTDATIATSIPESMETTLAPSRTVDPTATKMQTGTSTAQPQLLLTLPFPPGEYPVLFDTDTETVFLWNYTDGSTAPILEDFSLIETPLISPDSRYIAQRGRNVNLSLINLGDGSEVEVDTPSGCMIGNFQMFSWSPDSRYIAVACVDSVQIYQISSQTWIEKIELPEINSGKINGVDIVAWSQDGNWIAYTLWIEGGDMPINNAYLTNVACLWNSGECDFISSPLQGETCAGAITWLPENEIARLCVDDNSPIDNQTYDLISYNPIHDSAVSRLWENDNLQYERLISDQSGIWILSGSFVDTPCLLSREQKPLCYLDDNPTWILGWYTIND